MNKSEQAVRGMPEDNRGDRATIFPLNMVNLRLTLVLSLIWSTASSVGQVLDARIRQQVLEQGLCDSTFIFGRWSADGGTETRLTYLGEVGSSGGRTFRVMNSIWIWGRGMRATNRILIFNGQNRYLGNYCATTVDDLPTCLRNGRLTFRSPVDAHREVKEESVDLTRSLPRSFILENSGEWAFE